MGILRKVYNQTITSSTPAVKITDLVYSYPVSSSPVLKEISVEISPGEFVLLIGPSGCGKSTISLCLNGIIPRNLSGKLQGRIECFGWSPTDKEVYEMATRIGLVFQDADSQICNMFIGDEIAFGAQNLLVPKDEILKRMDTVLNAIGMEGFQKHPVYNLSGGQKQRVAIGSVLAMEPLLMVFDEPTANLDPQGTLEVHNLIRDLNKNHRVTTIVIEHDVSHFVSDADRMLVMDKGEIVLDGSPRQILSHHSEFLKIELGLWIPGACEFASEVQKRGYTLPGFPLTSAEIPVEQIQFVPRHESHSQVLPTEESIISMRDVSFTYKSGPEVLHNVSLDVAKNSIVAIVGQNGSGKTTLTSLLIGLNRPDSGSISVAGLDATKAPIRDLSRKIGYVFQYPEHQFITDTVYDEIAFSLKGMELDASEIEERVNSMLERFKLENFKNRHPFALSRGQKRRLSVASMLVMRPEIFILDEPTTGQDWSNVANLMSILSDLHKEGLTFIMVTHSMSLVAQYAQRVVVMHQGNISFDGTPDQLFSDQDFTEKYFLEVPTVNEILNRIRKNQPEFPTMHNIRELAESVQA